MHQSCNNPIRGAKTHNRMPQLADWNMADVPAGTSNVPVPQDQNMLIMPTQSASLGPVPGLPPHCESQTAPERLM